jgi:hypothetical protein
VSEPTPRPWPLPVYENDVGPDDDGFWEWHEVAGIAEFKNGADAELAVAAVNQHDSLIRQRDALLAACREMLRTFDKSSGREVSDVTRRELAPWLPMLADAIQLCEPEQSS